MMRRLFQPFFSPMGAVFPCVGSVAFANGHTAAWLVIGLLGGVYWGCENVLQARQSKQGYE